eukprot:5432686-Pyramimonas_sp.AAC.1
MALPRSSSKRSPMRGRMRSAGTKTTRCTGRSLLWAAPTFAREPLSHDEPTPVTNPLPTEWSH